MEKVLHHGSWKKEKAVTLVETVVALSIITIVSIAAVSISIYSANSFRLASVKKFFNHEISSISEIYSAYNNEADFATAFELHTGKAISGYTDTTYYLDSSLNYVDSYEGSSFYLRLSFEGTTLSLSANSNSGTALASRSVTK